MSRGKPKSGSGSARPKPKRRRAPARASAEHERALATLAHEIRTPLNGILAFGELLTTSGLPARERAWAAAIKDAARHLDHLTTLVVDSAKAHAGGLVLQEQPFRPAELASGLAESFSARAGVKGLTPRTAIADDLPAAVIGDAVRLRAVLENLIDNAIKFTERGHVDFSVTAETAGRRHVRLVFSVADEGIGLSRTEIRRLFRPFTQASVTTARRFGGAGLGLAFAAGVIKAMHGTLSVKSAPGEGSVFRLSVRARLATEPAGVETRQGAVRSRILQVLCAEDNPYGRAVINTILGELGHRIEFVGTGEEAVAAVARGGFDLVLMDVTLSGIDGLEAARRIRALPGEASRVRIIGLSGHASAEHAAAARRAGMDDYLAKPVSPRALAEAVARVARA